MCLRGILAHEPYNRLRRLALGHVGNCQRRHLASLPISEYFAQQGQHRRLVKITRHPQHDAVWMNGLSVKSHQIISGDAGDGPDAAFARRRMIRSIQQLDELAANDRTGVVLPAANPFDSLQFGQFNPRRLKGGCSNKSCKNLNPPLHILAEHIERRRTGLPSDRDAEIPRELFKLLVNLLGRQSAPAAGPHDRTGQRSQADLFCRIEPAARSHGRSHTDQGQLVVLQEIDDHTVLEYHTIRFGRGELHGLKRHLSGIAQRKISGTGGQYWDDGCHKRRAQHETPSRHVSRLTFHVSHRATSRCGAVATFFSPAFFTNTATVRFDFVK